MKSDLAVGSVGGFPTALSARLPHGIHGRPIVQKIVDVRALNSVAKRIMRQRTQLVLHQPFFGTLILRLRLLEDPTCETMWVDGVTLGYNPWFVESITDEELRGVFCHEVLHVAGGHCWRRAGRNPEDWNDACDYAINLILDDAKFQLPKGALRNAAFRGKCAEQIYDLIHRPKPPSDTSPNAGHDDNDVAGSAASCSGSSDPSQDDPNEAGGAGGSFDSSESMDANQQSQAPRRPAGEVRDPPETVSGKNLQTDWGIAVNQAVRIAEGRGDLPGDLKRLVEEGTTPVIDWRSVMRHFVQTAWEVDDYTWRLPSPRFIPHGLYLPRPASERIPCLVFFIDTSGSIYEPLLAAYLATVIAIAEDTRVRHIYIVYCDAVVQRVDEWMEGDDITFAPTGGGGTDFRPAFQWVEDQELSPTCAVFLTDLDGYFPEHPPSYPVLWVATPSHLRPPWGEYVELRD